MLAKLVQQIVDFLKGTVFVLIKPLIKSEILKVTDGLIKKAKEYTAKTKTGIDDQMILVLEAEAHKLIEKI